MTVLLFPIVAACAGQQHGQSLPTPEPSLGLTVVTSAATTSPATTTTTSTTAPPTTTTTATPVHTRDTTTTTEDRPGIGLRTTPAKPPPPKRSTKPPTTTPKPPPTRAQLTAALLGPADLPAGFTTQSTPPGTDDSSLSGCPPLSSQPAGAVTATTLLASTTAAITETLLQLTTAQATTTLNGYATIPTACATFSGDIDGYSVTFTAATLAFTRVGDASDAVRLTAAIAGVGNVFYEDLVFIRHGGTVIEVVDAGQSIADALTNTAADKAFSKVAARW